MNSQEEAILLRRESPQGRERAYAAVRMVNAGGGIAEVAHHLSLRSTDVERAWRTALHRQTTLRTYLQAQAGLRSLLTYPARGPWGQARYPGNCPGYLIVDLCTYFAPTAVLDPMEGSGTTREVCFDLDLEYWGRDLHEGFDLLSSPLPPRSFDLIFWHPPYWPGFRYTAHPNDFSRATSVEDYLERVKTGFLRLREILTAQGHLVLLIGDGRKRGRFYPVHSTVISWELLPVEAVLIKGGDHERRARHFRYGPRRFIPTLHEYVLIFTRSGA